MKPEKSVVAVTPAAEKSMVAQTAKLPRQQEALLEVLKNPASLKMSVAQICTKAGISRGTYYNSLEDETFLAHLESSIQSYLKGAEFPVLHNIVKKAASPKTQSHHWALMVMKMRGRLETESRKPAQVVVNFGNVVRPKVEVSPTGHVIIEGEAERADSD